MKIGSSVFKIPFITKKDNKQSTSEPKEVVKEDALKGAKSLEAAAVLGASQVIRTYPENTPAVMREAIEFEEQINDGCIDNEKYKYIVINGGDSLICERYSKENRDVLVPTYNLLYGAYAKSVQGNMSNPIKANEVLIYDRKTKTPVYLLKDYKGDVWSPKCSAGSAYKFSNNKFVQIENDSQEFADAINEAPSGSMLTTDR